MPNFRGARLTKELTFTTDGAAETARQRVQWTDSNGTDINVGSCRVEVVHLERTSGAGTVSFDVRLYSAAAGGKERVEKALSLDVVAGTDPQTSQGGYDVLFDAGIWATVQDSSGGAQGVKLQLQIAPATR